MKKINLEKCKKSNKGITLIALITTIIVLLILAGVTISLINGNENAIEKSQEAKEKTDISNEKEKIEIAVINVMSKNKNQTSVDRIALTDKLSEIVDVIDFENEPWKVKGKTGNEYIITEDGRVMTVEELYNYINNSTEVEFSKIEIADESKKQIRTAVVGRTNDNKCEIIETGIVLDNYGVPECELFLENIGGDIRNGKKENVNEYSAKIADKGYGIYVRGYVIVSYGSYTYTKYTEQLSTTYDEVLNK